MTEIGWRTALVTGASSGIGEAMARQLAGAGVEVIAVARREERLQSLAGRMPRGSIEVLPADLTKKKGLALVAERARDVDLLVNNAGFGTSGPLADADMKRMQREIRLNVNAVAVLTRAARRHARPRPRWICNVSSVVGFQPAPNLTVYAATKAFVTSFTEGLHEELRDTGVSATVLCPGLTRTEFQSVSNTTGQSRDLPDFAWMTADEVANDSDSPTQRRDAWCRFPARRTRRSSRRPACCHAASCAAWPASCNRRAESVFLAAVRFASVGSGRFAPQSVLRGTRRRIAPPSGLRVVDRRDLAELVHLMTGVDLADRARLRAHDERVGGRRPCVVVDAFEQVTVGDTGGREEAVLAPDQVFEGEDRFEVVAGVEGGPALVVVAGPQPSVERTAHALERGGGEHAFGRAADPEEDVGAGVGPRCRHRTSNVTVLDEADTRASARTSRMRSAWRSRSRITAVTSRTDSPFAFATASRFAFGGASGSMTPAASAPTASFSMYTQGPGSNIVPRSLTPMTESALPRALSRWRGAFERIDSDVGAGRSAIADALTVEEHRGFVLLALTDDDDAVHGDAGQHGAHGGDRRAVGPVLVATSHPARRGHCGRFCDSHELHGEVAIRGLR